MARANGSQAGERRRVKGMSQAPSDGASQQHPVKAQVGEGGLQVSHQARRQVGCQQAQGKVGEVAASEDVILVDQLARYTALGNGGVPWGLMGDAFHPNAAGHAALALELANALGIRPPGSRTLTMLAAHVATGRLNP